MIRCCLCRRRADITDALSSMEITDLPGSGFRCADHPACAQRVRNIVTAHVELAKIR
ncbi:MAG: hypothetical protein JWP32_2695 [Schumannella sp.]|nr:hypothetical protein [Schumannella sp.]